MKKRDQVLLAAAAFVAGCEIALAAGLLRQLQKYAVKAAAAAFKEDAADTEEEETAAAETGTEEAAEEEETRDAETV